MSISPTHQAALDYAAAGIPVFVCVPNGKAPATPNGFHDATLDRAQIDAWFRDTPDYNVAFCPHSVGWCVVDIDGAEGEAAWAGLLNTHGQAPETFTVQTPRGGRHLYFEGELPMTAWRPGVKRCLGEHLDTRGVGSYVLIPPSTVEGKPYVINIDRDLAPVPTWCAPLLAKRTERKGADVGELDLPGNLARADTRLSDLVGRGDVAISGRGGNNRTYQLAAELLELGLSSDAAYEKIRSTWNPHCIPPWTDEELRSLVENAASYAQNETGAFAVLPATEVFADALDKLPEDPQAGRLRFFPKGFNDPEYDSNVQPIPFDPAEAFQDPPPLETIVDGWVEKGIYIPLIGPGGTHKSRLLLQLSLAHLYGRQFLRPTHVRDFDDKSCRIAHVEFLNYENSPAEMDRRVFNMHQRLKLKAETFEGAFHRWDFNETREALAWVAEDKVGLTRVGERVLARIEKIRGHKLIILDSFFNAIAFKGRAKIMDDRAEETLKMLDHWCKLIDCTIMAPFHPSRAGVQREDAGYSPLFGNHVRQALSVGELQPGKKRGEPQTVPAGVYKLSVSKWNNGPQGKHIKLRYDGGAMTEYTGPEIEEPE